MRDFITDICTNNRRQTFDQVAEWQTTAYASKDVCAHTGNYMHLCAEAS